MSLIADLENAEAFDQHRGPRCTMCDAITRMPTDEATAVQTALANDRITSASLARVLTANGYRIAAGSVGRHRKGDCAGAAK